jgi:serine/threonine protein kinase
MRTPDFSQYDGGNQFVYQNKTFHRGKSLGCGSFAEVFLFETKDKKERYAIKCEKAFCHQYAHGDDFSSEAKWYEVIYGLGVLSGESKNNYTPHYILMPYFHGQLLLFKVCQSVKELFFYWILSAVAIRNLHRKHRVIHGDLKADNVVAGNNEIFLIDFGFTTMINHVRQPSFYPEDQFYIRHQSPELFSDNAKEIKAHESQDIYSLGCLLRNLFFSFYVDNVSNYSELLETQKKVGYVTQNMTHPRLAQRWSIEKSIYMLSVACLSQLPNEIWSRVVFEDAPSTSQSVFDTAIQVRRDELMVEQKKLNSPSPVKAKKIEGLKKLQERIAKKPVHALDIILEAKKDRALTAGVFSNRTEVLLCDLADIGRTFQLLHSGPLH